MNSFYKYNEIIDTEKNRFMYLDTACANTQRIIHSLFQVINILVGVSSIAPDH